MHSELELPIGTDVQTNTAAPMGRGRSRSTFPRECLECFVVGAPRTVALFWGQKTGPASSDSIARCSVVPLAFQYP